MNRAELLAQALDMHHLMTNPAECDCGDWSYRDEPAVTFNDHLAAAILAAAPNELVICTVENLAATYAGDRDGYDRVPRYVAIAELCDEQIDQSGALLGRVRDAAALIREGRG